MTPPTDSKSDPHAVDYAALAQRYMDLWQEQAAKLAQDPSLTTGLAAAWSKMAPNPFPFPFSGPNPAAPYAGFTTPTDGAKTAAAPPRDGGVDLTALLRRVDELERRVAVLEAAKPAAAARPGAKSPRRKSPKAG